MADFERNERFDATYDCKAVKVNRVWSGHRFTDEEVEALRAGDTIHFMAKAKDGHDYEAYGYLAEQTFTNAEGKEIVYVGFKLDFDSAPSTIPASFCGHTFSDAERDLLESGQPLHLDGLKSKRGNTFSADLTWGPDPENPVRKKIILSFD
jgi:DNA topoisomerase-3